MMTEVVLKTKPRVFIMDVSLNVSPLQTFGSKRTLYFNFMSQNVHFPRFPTSVVLEAFSIESYVGMPEEKAVASTMAACGANHGIKGPRQSVGRWVGGNTFDELIHLSCLALVFFFVSISSSHFFCPIFMRHSPSFWHSVYLFLSLLVLVKKGWNKKVKPLSSI